MPRPTVYGKQMVLDASGDFVGINIGYNFYCEHEHDTEDLCNSFNELHKYHGVVGTMKLKKIARECLRYKSTPFGKYMLFPTVKHLKCGVAVYNEQCKYDIKLMEDGIYDLVIIGEDVQTLWKKLTRLPKHGEFFVVREDELFCMEDYQGLSNPLEVMGTGIHGAWGNGYVYLFVLINRLMYPRAANGVVQALKAGHLALCPGEPRLFKDRGCCLIDVEKAYGR